MAGQLMTLSTNGSPRSQCRSRGTSTCPGSPWRSMSVTTATSRPTQVRRRSTRHNVHFITWSMLQGRISGSGLTQLCVNCRLMRANDPGLDSGSRHRYLSPGPSLSSLRSPGAGIINGGNEPDKYRSRHASAVVMQQT